MTFYNHHRPHSSLGGTPPAVFYRRIINATKPDQQVQKVA
jgi:putative transposase